MSQIMISPNMNPPKESQNCFYLCEKKLHLEAPELHTRFSDSVVAVQGMLTRYQSYFPEYTDHSVLHSLEVISFVNQLIGRYIDQLNCDEIYVLLMAANLHDTGMGVSASDYEAFLTQLGIDEEQLLSQGNTISDIIRMYHHELSGRFVEKYEELLDIPSPAHAYAIMQVARGHRKTDLWDEKDYPAALPLPNGNTVCLPYLASLLRLADELDISSERNLRFTYSLQKFQDEKEILEFRKHMAVQHMTIGQNAFYMEVDSSDKYIYQCVLELLEKVNQTLEECVRVVKERTPYTIDQQQIIVFPKATKEKNLKLKTLGDEENLKIRLYGVIDSRTAPELESLLQKQMPGKKLVVFDLAHLSYMSSAGLRILLAVHKTMTHRGKLVLINVSPEVQEIFEMTGFSAILNIE